MTATATFLKRQVPGGDANPFVIDTDGRYQLAECWASYGYTRGAEIGVWEGGFSRTLCEVIPNLHLICVDPWRVYGAYREKKNDQRRLDAAYETARARLAVHDCDIWRLTSQAAAARVADGSLDFVYIDANHAEAYVIQDLTLWAPKVRSGGMVAGHDYTDDPRKPHLEVKQAVDTYVQTHGIRPFFVLTRDKTPSFAWFVA